jgi:hypothetical protein
MKIDLLIKQLTELQAQGAETVDALDLTWNSHKIEVITTDATGRRALIFVDVKDEEEEEENTLPWPPTKA